MLRILEVPLFVLFVLFYFLICPCLTMTLSMLQCSFVKAHEYWSLLGSKMLNVRYQRVEGSNEINTKTKTMLLLNHRSWSDFFIHDVVTEYTANFVSRMAVGFIFPSIYILSNLSRSIWFFKRGGKDSSSFNKLFDWFTGKWETSFRQNVVIYPEGHRMYGADKPAFLKKGMIGYAYRNNIDVQIVVTFGNDKCCNEKKLQLKSDCLVMTYVDEIISTSNFKSEEEHYDFIVKKFSDCFEIVNNEFSKVQNKKIE